MTDQILLALVGVLGGGVVAVVIAAITGAIVPASRVSAAQNDAEKYKLALDRVEAAYEAQSKLLDRRALSDDVTDKVMSAVRDLLDKQREGSP